MQMSGVEQLWQFNRPLVIGSQVQVGDVNSQFTSQVKHVVATKHVEHPCIGTLHS